MFRRLPLATQLVVYLGALLVVLQALALGLYQREREEARRDRVAVVARVGQNAAAAVETFVRDIESSSVAMGVALGSQPVIDQPSAGPYLERVLREYPVLRTIFVTDARGRVIVSSATGLGADLATRPYMQALVAGRDPVWSGSLTGIETGEITVAFGRRIVSLAGATRGYLIFAFYPERLIPGLGLVVADDANLTLLDDKGLVLYESSRTSLTAAERDRSGVPEVRRVLAGELVIASDATAPYSERRYGAFVPITRSGWGLAYTRSADVLDNELRDRFLANAGATTAALALACVFVVFVTRRVTKPLVALARDASAIAQGERPRIGVGPSAGIEVTQLAGAMRQMASAVARREDDLRFLAEASEMLGSSLDDERVLRGLARLAVPRFADWCFVDVIEGGATRRLEVVHADPADAELAKAFATPPPDAARESPRAEAIRRGEPVLLPDVRGDHIAAAGTGDPPRRAALERMGLRSAIVVPLLARGALVAVISLFSTSRTYGDRDLALAQDLARRAATAIENARLYHQVQTALRTRDEFLSAAAHELKTPLTSIKGFAQSLQRSLARETADKAALVLSLQRIDEATRRMTSTVDELLDATRLQLDPTVRLTREPTDLGALVRAVAEDQQVTTERHAIRVESDGPVTGRWDRARLERVVANLLSNAVKYSPAGGDVLARVRREDGLAVLEVRDRGIGIPAQDLARIFDRFARGSNAIGRIPGTGIGLTLVRQIVDRHGGSVTVASEPEVGTTFTVTLPLDGD